MFDVSKLIYEGMHLDGVDKDKVIEIMVHGMREKESEKEVYMKLYKEIHGNTLTDENCIELVSMLYQGEERGQRWTLEETNEVARSHDFVFEEKGYTPREFWAAMHIQYYDVNPPLKKCSKSLEAKDWGWFADFYFTGDDEPGSRLVDYYFWRVKKQDALKAA